MKINANKGWYSLKYINIITIKIFNPRINSEGNNFIEYRANSKINGQHVCSNQK